VDKPHLVKYEGKWAWRIEQLQFKARDGFGGYTLSYARLVIHDRRLLEYAIAKQ